MINFIKSIKSNISKSLALTEKNIKLNLRFKFTILFSYITPIIAILMPLIIMSQFFQFKEQFGNWTIENYFLYQFIAYNIILLRGIITEFPTQFRIEKFWKTLPALMIAPFNRFNLLIGIFLSKIFLILIPFTLFFIVSCIFIPISFITGIFIIGIYFGIALIFSGIGLIIGVFAVSNENVWRLLMFSINIIFWASCLTYPFELFPAIFQTVINLNPLYYLFDILRLTWIENNPLFTFILYPYHSLIFFSSLIVIPCIGVLVFNMIFKKYGIVGY